MSLEFDPTDEEVQKMCVDIRDRSVAKFGDKCNLPYKKVEVENDDGTKSLIIRMKFHSRYEPQLFDSFKRRVPSGDEAPNIGSGSQLRIAYEEDEYEGFGGGITLYLKGVQVIKLVEFKGQTADDFGFESEDGYTSEDGSESLVDAEDDLPF